MPDAFAGLPVDDSDVAADSAGDYPVLAARCERLASGDDGAVAAGSTVLTASFPFASRGVGAGHVLVTEARAGASRQIDSKDMMRVVSAEDGAVTLGRFGADPGAGDYPAGVTADAGITGVKFKVLSVRAQIVREAATVRRRLNLAPDAATLRTDDLKEIVLLRVLRGLYFDAYRATNNDAFKSKFEALDRQVASEWADLAERYGDTSAPDTVTFGTLDLGISTPPYGCG